MRLIIKCIGNASIKILIDVVNVAMFYVFCLFANATYQISARNTTPSIKFILHGYTLFLHFINAWAIFTHVQTCNVVTIHIFISLNFYVTFFPKNVTMLQLLQVAGIL